MPSGTRFLPEPVKTLHFSSSRLPSRKIPEVPSSTYKLLIFHGLYACVPHPGIVCRYFQDVYYKNLPFCPSSSGFRPNFFLPFRLLSSTFPKKKFSS